MSTTLHKYVCKSYKRVNSVAYTLYTIINLILLVCLLYSPYLCYPACRNIHI